MTETYEERSNRFNETTGVFGYMSKSGLRGGNHHPDRCRCQGDPFIGDGAGNRSALGIGRHTREGTPYADTTPHKHRRKPPFSCARCSCSAYVPHDEAKREALREQARAIVEAARGPKVERRAHG